MLCDLLSDGVCVLEFEVDEKDGGCDVILLTDCFIQTCLKFEMDQDAIKACFAISHH